MSADAEKNENILLRLRKQDTPTGVSGATIELLAKQTGLSKTDVIHYALRQLADRYLPKYALDEGPLTDAQHDAIRVASAASSIADDRFTQSLF